MKKLFSLYILSIFILLSGCSVERPGTYNFSLTEEKKDIEITLHRVEEHTNRNYVLTVFHYLITNNTEEDARVNVEQADENSNNASYLKDGEGNFHNIMSYGGDGETSDGPSGGSLEIPANSEEVEVQIGYEVTGMESFETQVHLDLPDGETVQFVFNGELNEQNLIEK